MILNKSGFIINLIHINTNIPNLTVSRKLGGNEQSNYIIKFTFLNVSVFYDVLH